MQNEEMISPDVVQEMKETMDAAYSRRDYEGALETSYRILHHIPNDDDALYTIGYSHYMLSNYEEGLEACQTLLSHYPKFAPAFQLAGKIHLQLSQWDKALHFLEQALELTPSDATIHHNIAEAHYYSIRSLANAVGPFKSKNKKIFFNIMALAEKAISKAIELQPGDAGCHLLFSMILSSQIRDDEAEIQLREALLLEPMNPSVHCGYARLYYMQGKIKECRDHVQQALMLDAENEEALDIRSKLNQAQQRGSTYMNLAAKTDIKGVLDALKENDYYASSRIPVRMERNARDAFRLLPEEEVFAIIDMAIIRKGRAGLLFTDKGIYSKTIGSLHINPWEKLGSVKPTLKRSIGWTNVRGWALGASIYSYPFILL